MTFQSSARKLIKYSKTIIVVCQLGGGGGGGGKVVSALSNVLRDAG